MHVSMPARKVVATWTPIHNRTLTQGAGEAKGAFSAARVDVVFVGIYEKRKGESLPVPQFTANGFVTYL